jgi:hypothetical protein
VTSAGRIDRLLVEPGVTLRQSDVPTLLLPAVREGKDKNRGQGGLSRRMDAELSASINLYAALILIATMVNHHYIDNNLIDARAGARDGRHFRAYLDRFRKGFTASLTINRELGCGFLGGGTQCRNPQVFRHHLFDFVGI